jgi:DNA-nicking Smr family endonuclease
LKKLSEKDADLLRQALDGVVPLKRSGRIAPAAAPRKPPPRAPPASPVADTLSDHGASDVPLTEFLRNGVSSMTLRKLRRGHWRVQDSLDLHGLSSDAARKLLVEFLHDATQRGLHCVCVVHGKGWHTQGGEGILKIRTRHWLTQCAPVLAFCEAPSSAGGGGAVWVLLKLSAARRPDAYS